MRSLRRVVDTEIEAPNYEPAKDSMKRISVVLPFLMLIPTLFAQAPQPPQPLNSNLSSLGTSFTFSLPISCAACLETELGYLYLEDGHQVPAIVTAGLSRYTDFSAQVNLLDSEATHPGRATQFGNRVDMIVRQQVVKNNKFALTLAPRGTVFIRGGDGGRAGITAAPLVNLGANQFLANITWTGAVGAGAGNPRSDEVAAINWARNVQSRGTAIFAGFQQETTAGTTTASIEQGMVLAFKDAQIELATEQLNLNTSPQMQVQARLVVYWGKLFGKKRL
jgi:hypothetical protein